MSLGVHMTSTLNVEANPHYRASSNVEHFMSLGVDMTSTLNVETNPQYRASAFNMALTRCLACAHKLMFD